MTRPRLRDGKRLANEVYPFNDIPTDIITKLAGQLVYLMYTGRKDFKGDEIGDAFASAIGGKHLAKPIGIADVVWGASAWSIKTVKQMKPFSVSSVRLISGRCSPDYSYGITDPHEDPEETGRAVLTIWNERINVAHDQYPFLRTCVLIRSFDLASYTIYEEECHRYRTSDYTWKFNKNGNLIGVHKKTGIRCFTWQPHGAQFTIDSEVPEDAMKFKLKKPPTISAEQLLQNINFDESWVDIFR